MTSSDSSDSTMRGGPVPPHSSTTVPAVTADVSAKATAVTGGGVSTAPPWDTPTRRIISLICLALFGLFLWITVDVLPMTAGFEGYELRQEGVPPAYVVDSPGIENAEGTTEFVKRASNCDLILWVVPAHRADRELDRAALDAVRARFAADPARKMPPTVYIASHIDRLSPVREWAPPYNVEMPSRPKEQSIRAALEAIAKDLVAPIEAIVPMRLDESPPYNLELLWLKLEYVFGEAQRARWVRVLREAVGERRSSWAQVKGAGRMVGQWLKR